MRHMSTQADGMMTQMALRIVPGLQVEHVEALYHSAAAAGAAAE